MLTQLVNEAFRLEYFPTPLKTAEVILIPKQAGKATERTFLLPTEQLLRIMFKIAEKLLVERLNRIVTQGNLILDRLVARSITLLSTSVCQYFVIFTPQ